MTRFKKYSFLFFLFLSLQLFVLFFLQYTVVERVQMFISNHLYSTWNVILADAALPTEEVMELLPDNSRVFFEHDGTGAIRTFYQTGDWTPPMIEGEFFREDATKQQAVVGRNMLNGEYFTKGEEDFQVVGILGADFPSSLDNMALLANPTTPLAVERIVVDTDRISDVDEVASRFEILAVNENQAIDRFLNTNVFHQMATMNVVVITIFLVVLFGYLYFGMQKGADRVRFLLGVTKGRIFLHNIIMLLFIYLLGFFLVFIVDLLLGESLVGAYLFYYVVMLLGIVLVYSLFFFVQRRRGGGAVGL